METAAPIDGKAESARRLRARLNSLIIRGRLFRHAYEDVRWDEVDTFLYTGVKCLEEIYGSDSSEARLFNNHVMATFTWPLPLGDTNLVFKNREYDHDDASHVSELDKRSVLLALRLLIAAARVLESASGSPSAHTGDQNPETGVHSEQKMPLKIYKTALGRNIDVHRNACGLSFDDLASSTGLDKTTILDHVNKGRGAHPSTLAKYADYFSLKLDRKITVAELQA